MYVLMSSGFLFFSRSFIQRGLPEQAQAASSGHGGIADARCTPAGENAGGDQARVRIEQAHEPFLRSRYLFLLNSQILSSAVAAARAGQRNTGRATFEGDTTGNLMAPHGCWRGGSSWLFGRAVCRLRRSIAPVVPLPRNRGTRS